jgi:hypothetical protein
MARCRVGCRDDGDPVFARHRIPSVSCCQAGGLSSPGALGSASSSIVYFSSVRSRGHCQISPGHRTKIDF